MTGSTALPDTVNPQQMLFGINQGATYADLRTWHMQEIAKLDLRRLRHRRPGGRGTDGDHVRDDRRGGALYAAKDKPRYLMGVGTPQQHH